MATRKPRGRLGNAMPKPITKTGKNRPAAGSKLTNRMRPTGNVR